MIVRRRVLGLWCFGIAISGGLALQGATWVVVDRIAAIVGKRVIKSSDVDRNVRLTDFLNKQRLDLGEAAKRASRERLIDQEIIRTEIATGAYARASDADAEALRRQLERDRFGGSDARTQAELARYGLTENDLRAQLLWQLTVLRFIDEKFRPGVSVSDDDVHAYYDQHLAELKQQHPKTNSFDALQSEVRSLLEGEAVNRDFENWLAEARKRTRIEYRLGASR